MRSTSCAIAAVLMMATAAAAAPAIVVTAPTHGGVARPALTVQASCTDPGGCLEFQVRVGGATGPIVATGAATIDQSIDLAAYDGQATTLWIAAHDDAGQWTEVVVPIWVEASPLLVPVATVVGEVLDVDATRVLYVDPAGVARVRRRVDGVESALGPVRATGYGRLTSVGAIYASRDGAPGCATGEALYEWHGSGAVVEVDRACNAATARWLVDGDWGARRDSPLDVTRRDLRVGVETAVRLPLLAGHGYSGLSQFDVGGSGDIYAAMFLPGASPNWFYLRDRAGLQTSQPLNTASPTAPRAIATDGVGWSVMECTNIAFYCGVYRCLSPGVDCVGSATLGGQNAGTHWGLAMAGGWVYATYQSLGTPRLGRLTPSGTGEQVADSGAGDDFEAVSTFGAATVRRIGSRALLDVGGTLQTIGTNAGRGLFIGDDAYVAIGGAVFVVTLPTGAMKSAPPEVPTPATSGGCDAGRGAPGGLTTIALIAIAVLARRRRQGLLVGLLAAGACVRGDPPPLDASDDDAAVDAADLDAAIVDAATADAADLDATAIDAAPGGPWPSCTIDRRFDVGGPGLPAADIVAVDTGADLLMLFTDGPAGASAPLRWTRTSYNGDRLAGPSLLVPSAYRPRLVARDDRAMASYQAGTATRLQPFTASGPQGAAVPYGGYAELVALAPGLSDGFRGVSLSLYMSMGLQTVLPVRPSGAIVSTPGTAPQAIAALAITRVSLHTDGRLVATVTRAHPVPGCPTCTSLGVADLGYQDNGATVVEPTLPAGRIATARALTHRGTTYLTWIESNPDGSSPLGAIVRYPLDVVATIPGATALSIVATGNGVGVVGFQDSTGTGLRHFTDDLAGFVLGPACTLDIEPDQLVRIDGDTVLAIDAAGHARIVTFTP